MDTLNVIDTSTTESEPLHTLESDISLEPKVITSTSTIDDSKVMPEEIGEVDIESLQDTSPVDISTTLLEQSASEPTALEPAASESSASEPSASEPSSSNTSSSVSIVPPVLNFDMSSTYTSQDDLQDLTDTLLTDMQTGSIQSTSEQPLDEQTLDTESTKTNKILNIKDFEEGDSVQLISSNIQNKYHNKIIDFLYIDDHTIFLFDNESDDVLEFIYEKNRILENTYQIYNILKIKEEDKQNPQIFIETNLQDIEIIGAGIEIKEKLLSNWEREWTEEEYIYSIIENVQKVYKYRSYYDLDRISTDLFDLIKDYSLKENIIDTDILHTSDNVNMLEDLIQNIFTNNLIKPIVIDKRKIYSNKEENEILFTNTDSENKYNATEDIVVLDNKDMLYAEDSINKRYLLYKDIHTSSSLAYNADNYENELINGTGETPLPDENGKISNSISIEQIPYENIGRPYINKTVLSDNFNFEYFMMDTGLDYSTKVYRPNIARSLFTLNDNDEYFTKSTDIDSRIADNTYYRYKDVADKRRITDSFGRIKSSQICHGIKGEYMYSGSFNRKTHKDSFFNKSISKLPVRQPYINGEQLLICGFVLHNSNFYFPNFIESKKYIDTKHKKFKILHKSFDDGYTIYDYMIHDKKNKYNKIFDIQKNYQTHVINESSHIQYDKNNFIYFNPNKKYVVKDITIGDNVFTLSLDNNSITIHNKTTDNQVTTNISTDATISKDIVEVLLKHKLIYIDEKGIKRPLKNKLKQEQYLDYIRKIVPSISSIFNYEYMRKNGLQNSMTIQQINKTLSKYKLSYDTLPIIHRNKLKESIKKNIVQLKHNVNYSKTKYIQSAKNKHKIESIYNILDKGISKMTLLNKYFKKYIHLIQYSQKKDFKELLLKKIINSIKIQVRLYTFKDVTDKDLLLFLSYIKNNNFLQKHTDQLDNRNFVIDTIIETLYSDYNNVYFNNLFLNDVSLNGYDHFCLVNQAGVNTNYCSEKSLRFLKEFYDYNQLDIYNKYNYNSSIKLNHNQLQSIEMITLFKNDNKYELLFDIYKVIQIERELWNISNYMDDYIFDRKSSSADEVQTFLSRMLDEEKKSFMLLRETFNDELKKFTYFDACYGFKIVKVYKNKYDLLSDNINDQVFYDDIFDTTETDMDIINNFIQTNSIDIKEIEYIQQIEKLYDLFKKYYIFSPEYEIKNIVHNAIKNIQNIDITPKKNSTGNIIINNIINEHNTINWQGTNYVLSKDGIMTSESNEHIININELKEPIETLSSGLEINTYHLFTFLDRLNYIVINKGTSRRKVIDGEYCIVKDNRKRYIYKRAGNSWSPLSEDEVTQKGSCLLEQYKFKELLSLEFDDLLELDNDDIAVVDNLLDDSELTKKDKGESEEDGPESVSDKESMPSLQFADTQLGSEAGSAAVSSEGSLGDLGDLGNVFSEQVDLSSLDSEQTKTESTTSSTSATESNSLSKEEKLESDLIGGSSVPIGERVNMSLPIKTDIPDSFNPLHQCINTNNLPIPIQKIFENNDSDLEIHEYKQVMIPRKFIKFIFDINKQFNKIKELDHITTDQTVLVEMLRQKSNTIYNKLTLMKQNYEEREKYSKIESKTLQTKKIYKVPYNLLNEFNGIFQISDTDLRLTTLKKFIDTYGIYYKPKKIIDLDDQDDQEVTDDEYTQDKQLDSEYDPNTSKFIYWDPYFAPNVHTPMCCKHYIDLTDLAWLDNNNRTQMMDTITKKYCVKDYTDGDSILCKYCGEQINTIQYSSQEGFSSDDKPIYLREKIDETEYQYEDLNDLSADIQSKFNSKKILNIFIKILNVNVTKDDRYFIESNSYKTFLLHKKTQKDIYFMYKYRYHTKSNPTIMKQIVSYYDNIFLKDPSCEVLFDLTKKRAAIEEAINSHSIDCINYHKISKKHQEKLKKGLKSYSSYIISQLNIYNSTLKISIIMSYFILIVFYSKERYKIFSSGQARQTRQRFIIYDTIDKIKDKCIEIALMTKQNANKGSIWLNFITTPKILKKELGEKIDDYQEYIQTMLHEKYLNAIYTAIFKQPIIQNLVIEKNKYDQTLKLTENIIRTQPKWITFRPKMDLDYNYRDDTAIETLETLLQTLDSSSDNMAKIYTLLSNISEQVRKLSLEYISRINHYIILNKSIKDIYYISYQSSCCNYNIQQTYQDTLSDEIKQINKHVSKLDIAAYENKSDYYLFDSYRGLNQNIIGRHLLGYFYNKNILHQNYELRQERDELYNEEKDNEYKQYLISKIYKINYFVVTNIFGDDYVGLKRNFIDHIDPDYYMIHELEDVDEMSDALQLKLEEKYKYILQEYTIQDDLIKQDEFNLFINRKIDIILNYNGETQIDLTSKAYIYEINNEIEIIIKDKNCIELKEIVDDYDNFLNEKIKTVTYKNKDASQHKKLFKRSRFKQNKLHVSLSKMQKIEDCITTIFKENFDSILEDGSDSIIRQLLENIDNYDNTLGIDSIHTDKIVESITSKSQNIQEYLLDCMDIYNPIEGFSVLGDKNISMKNKLGNILIASLGNNHLKDEFMSYINTDLIVQGYIKGTEKHTEELRFRKRMVETNSDVYTIKMYNRFSKSIIIEFNKLYNLFTNSSSLLETTDIDDDEDYDTLQDTQQKSQPVSYYSFKTMYKDIIELYSDDVDSVLNEDHFIIKHSKEISDLLELLITERNFYNLQNMQTNKSIITIEFLDLLSKYVFTYILDSIIINDTTNCMKPFMKYIIFNILDVQMQIDDTNESIEDEIKKYQTKLNEQRSARFDKLTDDMKHLHNLYRNVNMGGLFSKRNEMEEKNMVEEIVNTDSLLGDNIMGGVDIGETISFDEQEALDWGGYQGEDGHGEIE